MNIENMGVYGYGFHWKKVSPTHTFHLFFQHFTTADSSLRTTFKSKTFQQRCLLKVCEWYISFNEADTIQHTKCTNSILFHVSPSSGLKGTYSLYVDNMPTTDLSRNKKSEPHLALKPIIIET